MVEVVVDKKAFFLPVVCSLLLTAGLAGCCTKIDLSLKRYSGFMSAYFDLSGKIDFSAFSRVEINGGVAGWADLSLLFDLDLEIGLRIDPGDFDLVQGEVKADIDQDGFDETVRVLVAVDRTDSSNTRIFLAWKGDEYTLDEGRCYLAWLDGEEVRLASARCGTRADATLCRMLPGDEKSLDCQACSGSTGECSQCDASGKVGDCHPPRASGTGDGSAKTDAGTSADAATDTGFDAAIGSDAAVDAGIDAEVGVDAEVGIDAEVVIDLSACEKEVIELAGEANRCGLAVTVDEKMLCENRSAEVATCYAAYKAADAFGQNTCSVIQVCAVFN